MNGQEEHRASIERGHAGGARPRTRRPAHRICAVTVTSMIPLLAGCFVQPEGDVATEFTPGSVSSAIVFDGQKVLAAGMVTAGHIYVVAAGLFDVSAGAASSAILEGVVRGTPITVPVELVVDGSLDTIGALFVPESDGEVIIELRFDAGDAASSSNGTLDSIRNLVSGTPHANYQILVTDFGFDDNGTSPRSAVPLSIGVDGERTGTLIPQDDGDYFLLQMEAGASYELTVEATHAVNVVSGTEDRFGQINFSVPSPGGVTISATATPGIPGMSGFSANEAETILLRVARVDPGSTVEVTVQYAISLTRITLAAE